MDVDRAHRPAEEGEQGQVEQVVGDDPGEQPDREGDDDPKPGVEQGRHQQRHRHHGDGVLGLRVDRYHHLGGQDQQQHQAAQGEQLARVVHDRGTELEEIAERQGEEQDDQDEGGQDA